MDLWGRAPFGASNSGLGGPTASSLRGRRWRSLAPAPWPRPLAGLPDAPAAGRSPMTPPSSPSLHRGRGPAGRGLEGEFAPVASVGRLPPSSARSTPIRSRRSQRHRRLRWLRACGDEDGVLRLRHRSPCRPQACSAFRHRPPLPFTARIVGDGGGGGHGFGRRPLPVLVSASTSLCTSPRLQEMLKEHLNFRYLRDVALRAQSCCRLPSARSTQHASSSFIGRRLARTPRVPALCVQIPRAFPSDA